MCGTNYAKNAHATSIGIPVEYEEAGRVYYQVWVNLRNGTKRESGGRGVNSRMVTTITRLFGINLCQDMTERDKTGHYHTWASERILNFTIRQMKQ